MMQSMMADLLPPEGITTSELPEPGGAGPPLVNHYCAQCHARPFPGMHAASGWRASLARMFQREEAMAGMMGIATPDAGERDTLLAYLQRNALPATADPGRLPDRAGRSAFIRVCSACHELPDPALYPPAVWPAGVARMEANTARLGRGKLGRATRDSVLAFLRGRR